MSEPKTRPGDDDQADGAVNTPGYDEPAAEPDRSSTDVEGDPSRDTSTNVEDPVHDSTDRSSSDEEDEIGYFADRRMP